MQGRGERQPRNDRCEAAVGWRDGDPLTGQGSGHRCRQTHVREEALTVAGDVGHSVSEDDRTLSWPIATVSTPDCNAESSTTSPVLFPEKKWTVTWTDPC